MAYTTGFDRSVPERSLRPFSSTEEYLLAVREDLAEWLAGMYPDVGIDAESFFNKLETGVLLCSHINNLIDRLNTIEYPVPPCRSSHSAGNPTISGYSRFRLSCRTSVLPGTFHARDNLCNCLKWCRAMQMKECLLFETDDLVLRKNEKSVVLCLMEVARIGAKLGFPAPTLIQFEKEIDADELRSQSQDMEEDRDDVASSMSSSDSVESSTSGSDGSNRMGLPAPYLKNVDQVVKEHVKVCRCQTQFPLTKVAPGKYRVGTTQLVIYVRILRNHVMVRVGGGWDTLDHFLEKHDPCRRGNCYCTDTQPSSTHPPQSHPPPTALPMKPQPNGKSTTELTPLQIVYKRVHSTQPPDLSKSLNNNHLVKSQTTASSPLIDSNIPKPRKISPPLTKAPLLSKLSRARSMDVSLETDLKLPKNTDQKVPKNGPTGNRPRLTRQKKEENILVRQTSRNSVESRSVSRLPRSRLTMQSRAISLVEETPKADPWEGAIKRHRQDFLEKKDKFDSPSSVEKSVVCQKYDGKPTPGNGATTPPETTADLLPAVPTNRPSRKQQEDLSRRESAEEGFFSDTSGNSDR